MRYFIATNLPFLSKTIKNHVKKTIKYINKLKSNIYHKLLVTNLLNRASVNTTIVEIPKIIEKNPVIIKNVDEINPIKINTTRKANRLGKKINQKYR